MFMRYAGNGVGHQKINPGSTLQSLKGSDLHDNTMEFLSEENTEHRILDNICESEHESDTDSEDEELRVEEQDDEEQEYDENNWSTL